MKVFIHSRLPNENGFEGEPREVPIEPTFLPRADEQFILEDRAFEVLTVEYRYDGDTRGIHLFCVEHEKPAKAHNEELLDFDTYYFKIEGGAEPFVGGAQLDVVFDGLPVHLDYNTEDGLTFQAYIPNTTEAAKFDLGYNPKTNKPQLAWHTDVVPSDRLRAAVDTLVGAVFVRLPPEAAGVINKLPHFEGV